MKRSDIDARIDGAVALFRAHGFALPPFAFWSPGDWRSKGEEADEIRLAALGWDLTDFGQGQFDRQGLLLFTLRNGCCRDNRYGKKYAEKIMIVGEGQVTPMHFHWSKAEDIINRGGGRLVVELYNATPSEELDDTPVRVQVDGITREVGAGDKVVLSPGESITLTPRMYHAFWGEPGWGRVLVGEVSDVNDDRHDNRFRGAIGRFPAIEEDRPARYVLCHEYGQAGDVRSATRGNVS